MPSEQLLAAVGMHKLTYFDGERLENLDRLLVQIEQINAGKN